MSRVEVADDAGDTMRLLDYGDVLAPGFKTVSDAVAVYKNLPNATMRDDDVMLCTYIKTGMRRLI